MRQPAENGGKMRRPAENGGKRDRLPPGSEHDKSPKSYEMILDGIKFRNDVMRVPVVFTCTGLHKVFAGHVNKCSV